jgi:hypothetical protein
MKKIAFCLAVLCSFAVSAQKKENTFSIFGGLESNSTWYMNDPELNVVHPEPAIRSNNYLFVNGKYEGWTAGIQVESYEDQALLNYNPKYIDTNVATYYLQYKNETVDITAGYFYEQFGSGLLLRSWEDRQLGINNALRGGRIIFTPWKWLAIKGLYGQQRTGFDVADADIYGTDIEFGLSDIFKFNTTELSIGGSYVGRDQKVLTIPNPNYRDRTDAYAARLNFAHLGFYGSAEYDYKSDDAVVEKQDQVKNNFIKPGQALLVNLGYSKKNFGIDGTFRRLENMSFYSEREAAKNAFNDRIMNYLPGLTKQQHYNLANIYVYQAQPGVAMPDYTVLKAGEIGGQIDVFYNFKKGSTLGGKHGTKIALNYSEWHALAGDYYLPAKDYNVDYLGFGKKYFSEYNVEIDKKWNERLQTIFTYIKQYNNLKLVQETVDIVNADIVAAEATRKFGKNSSIRIVGEHIWADADKKNWGAGTVEYNINPKLSFYANDMWNYGNDDPDARNHYYNFGSAFRYKSIRAALNYGRQRGGLVCVGGVCRFVPESSGLSLSLNAAF